LGHFGISNPCCPGASHSAYAFSRRLFPTVMRRCANMTSSTKSMPPGKDQATAIGLGKKHKIGEDWACSSGDKLVDRHTHTSFTSPLHYRPSPLRCFIPGLKPSSSANPFHRSLPSRLQDWLHRFPGLFTDISEHIRFLLFSSSLSHVLVVRFVR